MADSPRLTVPFRSARRLAIANQHLAGAVPEGGDARSILAVIRDLGCLQLDPINVVAPSQYIVLWSRLGTFPRSELETLLWKDRTLFEYWGHQASIVLTEDYPLYYGMMRGLPGTAPRDWNRGWYQKAVRWMAQRSDVRSYVLRTLEERGPLLVRQFDHPTWSKRRGSGWGAGGDLSDMLQMMFFRGEIMVAGRIGTQRLWDLPERCLPEWVSKVERPHDEVEYEAVQRSLRALGVATAAEIQRHFLRDRYPRIAETIERLLADSTIERVRVEGNADAWDAYVHTKDLPRLEAIDTGEWAPRTTLLSPFDNLICDRKRTERLFGFRYSFEGYVPKHQRKYGPYTLSILRGDRLIGRVDPLLDRKRGILRIHAVHAEPGAPRDRTTARAIAGAIDGLSAFLGATEVDYTTRVPTFWKSALH